MKLHRGVVAVMAAAAAPACAGEEAVGAQSDEVIGGVQSPPGARPWQAQLGVPGAPHYCGGSLVTQQWVLTAGHCVEGLSAGSFTVVLGEHDRTIAEGTEQSRSVDLIVRHPGWNANVENDVALLHLSTPVTLNGFVGTIGLASGGDGPGVTAIVSGWGQTAPGSAPANVLMEAALPINANSACDSAPGLYRDLFASELCAGYLNGEHGGCHGDSGGPLAVQSGGSWNVVGVVSWGAGGVCNTYTVFARVSSHRAWIAKIIQSDSPGTVMTRRDAALDVTALAGFDAAPPPSATFSDVPTWAAQFGPIEAMWRQGLTTGCAVSNGVRAYCPDSAVTRGQMAVFLARAFGITQTGGAQTFWDVPPSHVYYPFIQALATAGLAEPCPGQPGAFCPDAATTRGDLSAMLGRFIIAGSHPPGGSTITVTAGSYGSNAGAPAGNVTGHLAASCNGLSTCNYGVFYWVIGDPLPGIAKDYLAEWTCTPGGTVHRAWTGAEAGFGSTVPLKCP